MRLFLFATFMISLSSARVGAAVRTLPGGIIYPSGATAAWDNPARLIQKNRRRYFQTSYASRSADGGAPQFFTNLTFEGEKYGVGGRVGDMDASDADLSSAFLGVGFTLPNNMTVGLAVRDDDLGEGSYAEKTAIALMSGTDDISYGFVIRNTSTESILDIGLGYTDEEHYQIELSTSIPTFHIGPTPSYFVTFATGVFHGFLGSSLKASYDINNNEDLYTISISASPWVWMSLFVTAEIPIDRFHFGVTFVFGAK